MTFEILKSIKKFEELQSKYAEFGANDEDTDYLFQSIISNALSDRKFEIGEPIDWDLDQSKNMDLLKLAQEELTEQAWYVYTTILRLSQRADLEDLRRYCWRIY